MQAFRARATVSEDRELRISRVPFPPGSELEIILLEKEASAAKFSEADSSPAEPRQRLNRGAEAGRPGAQNLAQDQYRLAEQYPDEYVVLVGTRVVHHSPGRQEARIAYRQAWKDFPKERPVVVAPGGEPEQKPLFRGRSLTAVLDT